MTPVRPAGRGFLLLAAAVTAAVAMAYGQVGAWSPLRKLEAQTLDLRFQLRGTERPGGQTAVVLIDDRTIAAFGRWPLSRVRLAEAVRRLTDDGARAIAIDMLLPETETPLPPDLRTALREAGEAGGAPLIKRFQPWLGQSDPDEQLAQAVTAAGNVALAFAFEFGDPTGALPVAAASASPLERSAYARWHLPAGAGPPALPLTPTGVLLPLPMLAQAAAALAHVTVAFDADASLRHEYPVLAYRDEFYPSLPIAAVRLFLGLAPDAVSVAFGRGIRIGSHFVETDSEMRLLVDFLGPQGTIPTYSFADLVGGRVPAGTFRDRLVFLGATLVGVDDSFNSPFTPALPGVERYAMIADRVLADGGLVRPAWAKLLEFAAIVVLGLASAAIGARGPPRLVALGQAGVLGVWTGGALAAFILGGWWINWLFPALAVVANGVAGAVARLIAEDRRRRRAEQGLRASEQRYALAVQGANDGLWDWDVVADRVFFSARWQAMVGEPPRPVTAPIEHWLSRVEPADRAGLRDGLDRHLRGETTHFLATYRLSSADGVESWMMARGLAVADESGRRQRMAGSQTDITERKRIESQLLHDAFHDALTGAANRALLLDRLAQARALRGSGAVLVCAIDGTRVVADSLGPDAADRLLIAVARRLGGDCDPEETLARIDGEVFALLAPGLTGAAAAHARADRIAAVLSAPFTADGRPVVVQAAVGLALVTPDEGRAEAILRDATIALYQARETGHGPPVLFDPEMHARALHRFDLEAEMRRALERGGEFELFYQPIVSLSDQRLAGFEALIRWRHPERGLVSPSDFIPIAEETGLIVEIGRRSIAEACRRLAEWLPRARRPLQIAVNVSGRQLAEGDLAGEIRRAVAAARIPPAALKIEVTESLTMEDPERATRQLEQIVADGVKVSIDDFGTGYSSLAYLHRLPFHTLKIDRSFVVRMTETREAGEIVRVIVALARSLGRDVVAEGIETQEQVAALAALGVPHGQGYLFGRPEAAAEAAARVARG
ncbi:MAG: EAL domain-containing protein [Azospirillum sp.]|nr:EAL domain-containing protein [Azospirillum sp.]